MRLATCNRRLAAPVDDVWQLVSTAAGLERWLATSAAIDLRPGGSIRWSHDDGAVVAGEVRDVEPPTRLVFTYGWETGRFDVAPGSTLVSITLRPIDDTSTQIEIEHDGLVDEYVDAHTIGWTHFVERLADAAAVAGGG